MVSGAIPSRRVRWIDARFSCARGVSACTTVRNRAARAVEGGPQARVHKVRVQSEIRPLRTKSERVSKRAIMW
jgi:hypothetical protein